MHLHQRSPLSVIQITGSLSTSLKGMVFCPHLIGFKSRPTFSAETHQAPEENATYRSTLPEPLIFSLRARCSPRHSTKILQYWQRWNFLPLLLLKIIPYWLSDNVKHANRILSTQCPKHPQKVSLHCRLGKQLKLLSLSAWQAYYTWGIT